MSAAISVVIPTKNRRPYLLEAARSILAQTVTVDELIVIDQSEASAEEALREIVKRAPAGHRPRLHYVWDPAINGAAAARNAGLDLARGEIVVFHDDDVTADPAALARLLAHYEAAPSVTGIAPVITNYHVPGRVLRTFLTVFRRGVLRDERQEVYWSWRDYRTPRLVPVRMFTGAMMSFRRAALAGVRFDATYRGASVGEDIDFCWTLIGRGAGLAIATDARIVHHRAPRPRARFEEATLVSWGYLWDKHAPKTLANRLAFGWFVAGVVLGGVYSALRTRSLAPLRSATAGLFNLTHDYRSSSFLAPGATTAG